MRAFDEIHPSVQSPEARLDLLAAKHLDDAKKLTALIEKEIDGWDLSGWLRIGVKGLPSGAVEVVRHVYEHRGWMTQMIDDGEIGAIEEHPVLCIMVNIRAM